VSSIGDWEALRKKLREKNFESDGIKSQFFSQLLMTLGDSGSGIADCLSSYRDALLASPVMDESPSLPWVKAKRIIDKNELQAWGLCMEIGTNALSLCRDPELKFEVSDGFLDTTSVYRSEERRKVQGYRMDPSIFNALKKYREYQGAGQRDAVRHVLTDTSGGTFLIDLPTGVGKTLVIEAVNTFSGDSKTTLVIVPTVALALDQEIRVAQRLRQQNVDHGGSYCWHSSLGDGPRKDILERLRNGRQRVLICAPEAALTSLRGPIVSAARSGVLSDIVIDEAHLVDHWGASFRPDFQALSAVVKTCRRYAASEAKEKIRCILLSATYGPKTVRVLTELFSNGTDDVIEIHGSFLRPEIQYSVRQTTVEDHESVVLQAVRMLPKPMIIYVTEKKDANDIFSKLEYTLGLKRISKFTGDTSDSDRKITLEKWSKGEIDIVVATSAFGVGINKANVRSVLHASVPENIDRFYQEVGRSGRDGLASQSLLVFHEMQFSSARSLNQQQLIGPDLGLNRWENLWAQGKGVEEGKREIDMGSLPSRLEWTGDGNQKWNWRTLMLMLRSGAVDVELSLQESRDDEDPSKGATDRKSSKLLVETKTDNHRESSYWQTVIQKRRRVEQGEEDEGFDALHRWLLSPNQIPLCESLVEYYTVEGRQPELACAGCPSCRFRGAVSDQLPVVGRVSHVAGYHEPASWPVRDYPNTPRVSVFYDVGEFKDLYPIERFVDRWVNWISPLLQNGLIGAIRSSEEVLDRIQQKLPRAMRRFWVGLSLKDARLDEPYWRELVIVPPDATKLPQFGLSMLPRILVAPESLPSSHPNRNWTQDNVSAISLGSFIERLNCVVYK